jgi:hypothetical protein
MNGLQEKIAYLQGLAEGINLDKESKEGKLFMATIDVLDEMALMLEGISLNQKEVESYLEALDEDLGDLEDDVYGEDDEYVYLDDDDDVEQDGCDEEECDCSNFVEVACPHCFSVVNFEAALLEDEDVLEITCPNCDEVIFDNNDNLEMQEELEEE